MRFAPKSEAELLADFGRIAGRKIPFTIQSSGHCFAGLSQTDGTLIDLRQLNGVSINEAQMTATVGPGATIGDVNAASRNSQLAMVAGYCQTVAMGGHISGGGVGILGRRYGLACDQMLQARVVLANGNAVTASNEQNADLFWALRGGGAASFGIVSQYTLRLHRPSTMVLFNLHHQLSVSDASRWISQWQKITLQAGNDISFQLYVRNIDGKNVGLNARIVASANSSSLKDVAAALFLLRTPREQPRFTSGTFHEIADKIWPRTYYGERHASIRSDYLNDALSEDQWFAALSTMVENVEHNISFSLEALGGEINTKSPDETAYWHRKKSHFLVQYQALLNPTATKPDAEQALLALQHAVGGAASGAAYFNYPETDRPNWGTAYWGENFERLKRIKAMYDPDNLFHHALSIPLPS